MGKQFNVRLMQSWTYVLLLRFKSIVMWNNVIFCRYRYLRVIDRFNNYVISAYMTPGGMQFLLLHEGQKEDSVRSFFTECHELYVKNMMNPFAQFGSPIVSRAFDNNVKRLSKKIMGV